MKLADLKGLRRYVEINRYGVAKLIRRRLAQARDSFGRDDWDENDTDHDVWVVVESQGPPIRVRREKELRDLEEDPDYADDLPYERRRTNAVYDCAELILSAITDAAGHDTDHGEEIVRLVQETEKDADLEKEERIALAQIDTAIKMREALDAYLTAHHKRDSDTRDEAIEKIQEMVFNEDDE